MTGETKADFWHNMKDDSMKGQILQQAREIHGRMADKQELDHIKPHITFYGTGALFLSQMSQIWVCIESVIQETLTMNETFKQSLQAISCLEISESHS